MLLTIRGHDPLPAEVAHRVRRRRLEPATAIPTSHNNESPSSTAPASDDRVFHYFPLLPLEIRREIWLLCMPHRVVELSDPAKPRFRYNRERVAPAPRGGPVLAHVCYEARSIALEHGGSWKAGMFRGRIAVRKGAWFDCSRDTLLLNAEDRIEYHQHDLLLRASNGNSASSSVSSGDSSAGTPAVVTGDSQSQDPEALISCLTRARGGVAMPFEVLQRRSWEIFPLIAQQQAAAAAMAAEDAAAAGTGGGGGGSSRRRRKALPWAPMPPAPLMVFFDDVQVWGARAQAIASGLFGHSADEPLRLVALDDTAQLQRIRDLDAQPGALRVGHRGFMRWLLTPAPAQRNQAQLETLWNNYYSARGPETDVARGRWKRPPLNEMPTFKHVVLFRFCEE